MKKLNGETKKRVKLMNYVKSLIAFLFLLSCLNLLANSETSLEAEFQTELENFFQEYDFPGATAAYILPDGKIGTAVVGMADVEENIKMQPTSKMLAASIGKTFVGATVLAIVQEDKLELDGLISTWLQHYDWFSRLPNNQKITLRHLLTHSSGLADHVHLEQFSKDVKKGEISLQTPPDPERMIQYVLDEPALFEPGEGWHYSDTGYLLVGLIIDEVTGNTFYKEVEQRFLSPLNLEYTVASNKLEINGLASGYMAEDNMLGLPTKTTAQPGVMAWNPALEGSGGGFASNPQDLVKWAKNLYEGKAMQGNYLEKLLDPVPISKEIPGIGYGLGVAIYEESPLGPVYGHGGWIPGYSSSLRYYAKQGVAVAFQINTDIGIVDDSTDLVQQMEKKLAKIVVESVK